LEYANGSGDNVTFNDSSYGIVIIPGIVKPGLITVNVSSSYYWFTGAGTIGGSNGIAMTGTSTLEISTSNSFTGGVSLSGGSGTTGGMLFVDNPNALGATNGGVVVSGPANTLEIGYPGNPGVTVTGQTATIRGTGVDGSKGVLRGAATASGSNVWAGPVILAADQSRIGTEDGGNLTVSGGITDNGANYGPLFRPGAGSLTLSGTNNSWGGASAVFGSGYNLSTVVLAANNVLPTGSVLSLNNCTLDLAGNNHTVAGLTGYDVYATILNNGSSQSTLTLNPAADQTYAGVLMDGTSMLALVKNGPHTQTFTQTGANIYTGAIVVNGGTLAVVLPVSSTSVAVNSNATLTLSPGGTTWMVSTLTMTNAALSFNYSGFNGDTNNVILNENCLNVTNLVLFNTNLVNVMGSGFTLTTNYTLLTYWSKTGGGAFALGTLPAGVVATLVDNGSSVALDITAVPTIPVQNLVWSGGDGIWQTNGSADWNINTATYEEYAAGGYAATGDYVTFNDSFAGGTVNLPGVVMPGSVTVSNTASAYVFSGAGSISGPNSITKLGTNTLTLSTSNSFTGGVTISDPVGGYLLVNNPSALGMIGCGAVVSGPANTLEIGTIGGPGVIASGYTATITGKGVGGSKGALRGAATASGSNVWAGSVIINGLSGSDNRIGTEDNGNLTVSGQITDNGSNTWFGLRPGTNGVLTISGTNNLWGSQYFIYGGDGSGKVVLGANSALYTNSILYIGNAVLDLNGYNQTIGGIGPDTYNGTVINNGASLATLTINQSTNLNVIITDYGNIEDGLSQLALVKTGTNTLQILAGTNSYTGPTDVKAGELQINGSLSNTVVTVHDSARLSGSGGIAGPVTVNSGAVLAPGNGVPSGLTINNSLILKAGGTSFFTVNAATTNSTSVWATNVVYGGGLSVTNTSATTNQVGQVYTLFNAGHQSGTFTNAARVAISDGTTGSFNPATGQLTITSVGSSVNTNAAPIAFSVSGSALSLSWPADHLGWRLLTNSVNLANPSDWFAYPGSASLTNVVITIDPTKGNVFYRLVYP
jgi:autotransporter-associated beta strand protein